ncbi:hypothetical protein M3Y94_00159400 [Aphelenchoides besseyi]|nr:hypothetical protein M3Y94_00159400 [Aphelenchoides besseyi]KAI6237087.1 hypothetical protein M3Y95_00228000 [Aphelenchoides besseyi]
MKRFSLRLFPRKDEHQPLDEDIGVVDGVVLNEKKFGVRSYLKQFYSPSIDELDNPGAWYLLPPSPAQRLSVYLCRCVTLIGLLLLLAGAALIVFGYTWKSTGNIEDALLRISIDQDEDGNFYIPPERFNALLMDPMHVYKMAGFCIFSIGACLLAISLIVPSCAHVFGSSKRLPFVSEDNTPNEAPKVYAAVGSGSRFKVTPSKLGGSHRVSPSGPVPVMEVISNVQPESGKKPTAELEVLLQ